MLLYVSHWIPSVTNLGPGSRTCIWFSGCSKDCEGCCSPELKQKSVGTAYAPDELAVIINSLLLITGDQGITISGGDPLEQDPDALCAFLSGLETEDILVYTGYTPEELAAAGTFEAVRNHAAALVCGRYVKALDDGNPLVGSQNQEIVYRSDRVRQRCEEYMRSHSRQAEYYVIDNTLYFTGLPKKETED